MSHPPATSTVHVDNDRVRIIEWRLEPGTSTGPHRHEYDYVVVPSRGGTVRIELPDGSAQSAEMVAQVPYYRDAGVEHDVVNPNEAEIVFVEVEIK